MRSTPRLLALTLCVLQAAIFAQAAEDPVAAARALYAKGAFGEAFALIDKAVPDASHDTKLKTDASAFLSDVAVSEYGMRNFKNAYDAVRKAIKLSATNSVATQYYVKIRGEMDVTALKNENEGKAPAASAAPGGVTSAEIERLMARLSEANSQVSSVEQSTKNVQTENLALRKQLEDQRLLTQQTLAILNRLTEAEAKNSSTPIVLPKDPALDTLTSLVGDQQRILVTQSRNNILILVVSLAAFLILGGGGIIAMVLLLRRYRRLRAEVRMPTQTGLGRPAEGQAALPPSNVALLEYTGPDGGQGGPEEPGLRRGLIRAERLTHLYEEFSKGELSWDTLRAYLDELDSSLKGEILRVVENKILESDLVTNEAVLPVLFPFLTEYDDYLRMKAEAAARSALTAEGAGNGKRESDEGLFGIHRLLEVPERLKAALKGRDQSLVTARLARGIAQGLGLPAQDCQTAYKASLAHDAGYLMLDQERLQAVLAKTEIDEADFEFIKSHTVKGPLYFGEADIPQVYRDCMLYHHERNDGSGYPDGRKKEEIPVLARIIGAAESFAALVSSRPHREKMAQESALAIIRDARSKFDKEIVDALVEVVRAGGTRK